MARTLLGSLVGMLIIVTSAHAQTARPGFVEICDSTGPAWIPADTPEYLAGHMKPCTEETRNPGPTFPSPTPPPEYPPEIQGQLEVGKYYKGPYGQVYKVIGIVSPIRHPEPTWLLQQVTAQGGICGYLSYIPMSHSHAANALDEVPPQQPSSTCPIAGDVQR